MDERPLVLVSGREPKPRLPVFGGVSRTGAAVNPGVDAYIEAPRQWPEEIAELRPVLLGVGLPEEIKWRKPCYSHRGKNIVILQEMKDFLASMFFRGPLLSDPDGVLEDKGPNSRSACRIQFTSVEDVARLARTVAAYVEEAATVEALGVKLAPPPELVHVEELRSRLDRDLRSCWRSRL